MTDMRLKNEFELMPLLRTMLNWRESCMRWGFQDKESCRVSIKH